MITNNTSLLKRTVLLMSRRTGGVACELIHQRLLSCKGSFQERILLFKAMDSPYTANIHADGCLVASFYTLQV